MGASPFWTVGTGKDVAEAFTEAVESAQWEHGHGGYTGTIAEKHEYTVIKPPGDVFARCEDVGARHKAVSDYAHQLVRDNDPRIDDKWGPAGAMRLGDAEDGSQRWLFFGWASD